MQECGDWAVHNAQPPPTAPLAKQDTYLQGILVLPQPRQRVPTKGEHKRIDPLSSPSAPKGDGTAVIVDGGLPLAEALLWVVGEGGRVGREGE